jgi:hypothetical protein
VCAGMVCDVVNCFVGPGKWDSSRKLFTDLPDWLAVRKSILILREHVDLRITDRNRNRKPKRKRTSPPVDLRLADPRRGGGSVKRGGREGGGRGGRGGGAAARAYQPSKRATLASSRVAMEADDQVPPAVWSKCWRCTRRLKAQPSPLYLEPQPATLNLHH